MQPHGMLAGTCKHGSSNFCAACDRESYPERYIKRICIACGWIGNQNDCMDYKHPTGAHLCPECYEITEIFDEKRDLVK